jgi:hypothetical protein
MTFPHSNNHYVARTLTVRNQKTKHKPRSSLRRQSRFLFHHFAREIRGQ